MRISATKQLSAVAEPQSNIDLTGSLVLVSCVKSKLSYAAPARDLYISAWFTKVRGLVESQNSTWFILSALYGLVGPDKVILPYDRTLKTMGIHDRQSWATKILGQLDPFLASIPDVTFFAGQRYREFLINPLRDRGITVEVPMEGLPIGRQLAWLTEAR
ncbi:MAG: hypothetical protein RLP02_17630 [Coleofasciculus sp. C2-GNP5-27]